MITILLLMISNVFMTIAWYGQLRFPHWSMIAAILIGWGIALVEYCFAVPANRIGYQHGFTGGQLKIIQEVITLTVFAIFIGWGIALVEYCFAVPANRIGYQHGFTGGQLKIIQEVITLTVFAIFAAVVLKEPIGWRYLGAFACLMGAAGFMFVGRG